MIRATFEVDINVVEGDYRPIYWPIKYPYWCSSENEKTFTLVAFADSLDHLYGMWPEAFNVEYVEVENVFFTGRFRCPDWYSV